MSQNDGPGCKTQQAGSPVNMHVNKQTEREEGWETWEGGTTQENME